MVYSVVPLLFGGEGSKAGSQMNFNYTGEQEEAW
jgi:hypothetical protein